MIGTYFPTSGVETAWWLPPLVACVVSFFTSMAGVSGAFLLLPFQMSVLGFTSPAVTPTNLRFNVVAIPSGVYRYLREGRLLWPLTAIVVTGTVPGVVIGGYLRLEFLPDPRLFKVFVGCVLLLIGSRMGWHLCGRFMAARAVRLTGIGATPADSDPRSALDQQPDWAVQILAFNWRRLSFRFRGRSYSASSVGIFLLSVVVGVIGGTYGIGGGAIMAPVFVSVLGLPVHAMAGAALMGTFVTSVVGVAFFQLVAPTYAQQGIAVAPDWQLGLLLGLGGVVGMYLGARCQRFVPEVWLKLILTAVIFFVAGRYLVGFWTH